MARFSGAADDRDRGAGAHLTPRSPSPSDRPWWKKLLLGSLPLVLLLAAGEAAMRAKRGELFANYRGLRLDMWRRGMPAEKDPWLGYRPRPSYSSRDNYWTTQVTIDPNGFRSNGGPPPSEHVTILAVGDSFTFGDQVHDHESWPAQLERILGQRVLNGGVFGYSLTQTVLRAERTLEHTAPEWVIVSFIASDIERSEFAKRYTWNPWFDLEEGELVLRNSPVVEQPPEPAERRARRIKDMLGRSALIDGILAGTVTDWWFMNEKIVRAHPPGMGVEIAKGLVDRIDMRCADRGCRVLLLHQGRATNDDAAAVLAHARARGVPVLDLVARLGEIEQREPDVRERYFDGHMTAEGNAWVAEEVALEIRRLREVEAGRSLAATVR